MTRGQRAVHRWLWAALAPLLLAVIAYAVWQRSDASSGHPPATAERRGAR